MPSPQEVTYITSVMYAEPWELFFRESRKWHVRVLWIKHLILIFMNICFPVYVSLQYLQLFWKRILWNSAHLLKWEAPRHMWPGLDRIKKALVRLRASLNFNYLMLDSYTLYSINKNSFCFRTWYLLVVSCQYQQ